MAQARFANPGTVQEEARRTPRSAACPVGPHVPSARLSGGKDRYKIKLRGVGYRLVYEVHDAEVIVIVVAVGRRDRNAVYKAAQKRTDTAAMVETMRQTRRKD